MIGGYLKATGHEICSVLLMNNKVLRIDAQKEIHWCFIVNIVLPSMFFSVCLLSYST